MKQKFKSRAATKAAVLVTAVLLAAVATAAPDAAVEDKRIRVRLVAAETPDKLISDLESVIEINAPAAAASVQRQTAGKETKPPSLGDDATLWVFGATVNKTNTFERYYKDKYINRSSELLLNLGPGEHTIDPGRHVFLVGADGAITSQDPDIIVDGRTVMLKTYPVEFANVDADKSGPPESRLLGKPIGVGLVPAGTNTVAGTAKFPTVLDRVLNFCPLRVYLPANTNANAYFVNPSAQEFRVLPGGKVELTGLKSSGISVDGSRVTISFVTYSAWVRSADGLGAVFAGSAIPQTRTTPARIRVGPTRGDPLFAAGVAGLSGSFGLRLSADTDRYPDKFMVAENMRKPMSVRLMALESGGCVFERGLSCTVRLQFKQNYLAITPDELVNARMLVEALRAAAETNAPAPATNNPVAVQARRLCKYLLEAPNGIAARAQAEWLAEPDAAERKKIDEEGMNVFARINAFLGERAFFDAKTLGTLGLDAGLAAETAQMATLDDDRLARVNRRLLEVLLPGVFAAAPATAPRPKVRLGYSPYDPVHAITRTWTYTEQVTWEGDMLTFQTPDVPYGFYMFRVMLVGAEDQESVTPLVAEFPACVIEPKQDGTASFVSNKGRDAFVPGEAIRLQVVFRSRNPHPAGSRTVVLRHPDGREDRLSVEDAGGKWQSRVLTIPEEITRRLAPGGYMLSVTNLSAGMACYPFRFDMAAPRTSLFRTIKSTKYTYEANTFEDPERGIATLAELGYNRFDRINYASHSRPADGRAVLAQGDDRLMTPDSLYLASETDRTLNACVRNGIEFCNTLHVAGDNYIPRYVDPYLDATERWARREVSSMRHSPAFDGLYSYQESYESGLVGVKVRHTTAFPAYRLKKAAELFTNPPPARIRSEVSKNMVVLKTNPERWDSAVMDRFLELRKWEMHGWGDFNTRVAQAARELLPRARMGTYHCSFMFVQNGYGAVMSATDFDNGYHPDVFENLDIANCQHYHDGPTIGYWAHSPIMAQLLRESPTGGKRLVWVTTSMHPEARTLQDGQLQRQMAFAMLAQGVDGNSTFWLPESFRDGPNPSTIKGKETTRLLNTEILWPFGETVARSRPGYLKVGIVNTFNQLAMSEFGEFKQIRTANQLEELWVSCWRLGYPAVFLREADIVKPLDGYQLIFVPGIRFPGEIPAAAMEQLRKAIAAGIKVVVERDSTLDAQLPGVIKMKDLPLTDYYYGAGYNVASSDDEYDLVFRKSQRAVDYLGPKMVEWGIESAGRGSFKVGPNWRTGGEIQYLLMSNYDDPDYEQTCRDIMAKPVRMPLSVPAYRGAVAYDLLAKTEIPLVKTNANECSVVLDMTRCQGALVAFLQEKIGALRVTVRRDTAGGSVMVNGTLVGESGKDVAGIFPATIRLQGAGGQVIWVIERALDSKGELEVQLPLPSARDGALALEVVENISGKRCRVPVEAPAVTGPMMRLEDVAAAYVPYPSEVARFVKSNTNAVLVLGRGMDGMKGEVDRLVAGLNAKGMKVTVVPEHRAWRVPVRYGIPDDPTSDGFHDWMDVLIAPGCSVESPVIVLSAAFNSFLLNNLVDNGFLTESPAGGAGLAMQPTVQVASRGLHWKYDTLCMVANDAAGVRSVVSRVLEGEPAAPPAAKGPSYGQPEKQEGREAGERPAAMQSLGNNEYVVDMKFDAATNLYVITWGHGDNFYSLDPKGALRFSRRLPEMGASRVDLDTDRAVVFTAYGSRLYQVGLDGKPISQARLTMDSGVNAVSARYRERHIPDLLRHGLETSEMQTFAELFNYEYVPGKRLIVFNETLMETMRVLDENFSLVAEWKGSERKDADGNAIYSVLGEFACSPDGTRVAQFEDGVLVVRDITQRSAPKRFVYRGAAGKIAWPAGAPGPVVGRMHFNESLECIRTDPKPSEMALYDLGAVGTLIPDGADLRLVRRTATGDTEVARFGPFACKPTFITVSPDQRHMLFVDEYRLAVVHEIASGRRIGQVTLPEAGFAMRFAPDSRSFVVGGLRGRVMSYDLSGAPLWSTSLMPFNQTLQRTEFPAVDPAFVDHTGKLYQPLVDMPGDIDAAVALDPSRLINGDCEADGGWRVDTNSVTNAASVAYVEGGYQSKRCLQVGAAAVQQEVEGLIGDHFTWVLEFFHRSAVADKSVSLLAGLAAENRYPDSVVRVLPSGKDWQFSRVAFKSGADPKLLRVGFQGQGGEVLVDNVTLRRIRFPSVNHMLHPPVYDIEPVVLHNPLFLGNYNPIGTLREQIPNIVLAERLEQIADALLVDTFLQNGRLNDVSSDWYIGPLPRRDSMINLGIKNPRWVSTVALYFNAYDEANTPRHFDILVSDVAQKKVVRVASVRNNRSLFRVVTFPARRADEVRVAFVNTLPFQRTLTEVEVYGPLSGGAKEGSGDAAGQNTYMGNFARVDKRTMSLAARYETKAVCGAEDVTDKTTGVPRWAMPISQALMADGNIYLSRALGFNQRLSLDAAALDKATVRFRTGAMGFGPHVALHGGALLKPGSDGKLYCIDPASCRPFWTTLLGERLTSSPVAIGLDVFAASDTRRLCTLDLASGAIIGETNLSGRVYGSLATDGKLLFVITDEGRLHGIQAGTLRELWSVAVAPLTDSTPAVDADVVYMADQKGVARAIQSADGKVLWTRELGSEFCRCPVVLPETVVFGCADGRLINLNRRTGEPVWQTQLQTRFLRYEPVPLLTPIPVLPTQVADRAIQADGVMGDWGAPIVKLTGADAIAPADRASSWKGESDLGAKVFLAWDAEALYVAAEVTDNVHTNVRAGDKIWDGDAVQVGLVTADGSNWNFAVALTTKGVAFWQFAGKPGVLSNAVTRAVVRDDAAKATRYEIRVPLAAIGAQPGSEFAANLMVFDDDDGRGQRYGMQCAPGLTYPFKPDLYPRYVMAKRPEGSDTLPPLVPAPPTPVLLCMSAGKPVLIEVGSGQPANRQLVTGSAQKDGKYAPDASVPSFGELAAPISYYSNRLAFVPIQFDNSEGPMYNDTAYHRVSAGSVQLLNPYVESGARQGSSAKPVMFLENKVVDDGNLDEWGMPAVSLDGPDAIYPDTCRSQGAPDGSMLWQGYDDLGAKVYVGWDSNMLHIAANVTDDQHFNARAGAELFDGDAMQVGISDSKNVLWKLGLALTRNGVEFTQTEGGTNLAKVVGYAVTRYESKPAATCYELSLPLAALGLEPGMDFGFNVVFFDDDKGNGQRYWLQLGPGLAGWDEKNGPPVKVFKRFVLAK